MTVLDWERNPALLPYKEMSMTRLEIFLLMLNVITSIAIVANTIHQW
jgi:hypothetical protein